jgi:hypothetical protein
MFYEQQINLYAAICDAAAKVATAERLQDVKDDLRTFNTLYWGKMCIVESPRVEMIQRKIQDELARINRSDVQPPAALKQLCYQLAHACRDDLEAVFNPKIGQLPSERTGPSISADVLKATPGDRQGKKTTATK